MDERVAAAWRLLPDYLSQHVLLSAAALGLGVLISLPLTVAAIRSERLRWPVLAFASLIQTIPGLALLALFYPLLLALSALSQRVLGQGFSALGFLPSLLALTLYSMLPIIRNGVTGVLNLDRAIIEAAHGVGMTDRERLLQIELPLAAPMLMAGVRTAAVWVIGAATLSTPVGQTSLGNYIFTGLQLENWVFVLFGCMAAAVLALLTDQMLALIEAGTVRRSRARILTGLGLLLMGIVLAAWPHAQRESARYVVGAKSFSEQYILAALISGRIEAQGGRVQRRTGLGSAVAFRALLNDEVDVYVDYSGTVWANFMDRKDTPPRAQLLDELSQWLQERHGVRVLGTLGFENAYALAMRREQAQALGIDSISDLAEHASSLSIGGDFEFFGRPEWQALRDGYELRFVQRREYQSTFMYRAISGGDVDVISAFSSDGRILAGDLQVLTDPLQAIPPYDALILVSRRRAQDPLLERALSPLVDAIDVESMREANLMVDRDVDKRSPAQAARWLSGTLGIGTRHAE